MPSSVPLVGLPSVPGDVLLPRGGVDPVTTVEALKGNAIDA